jgi:hypothetical protein
MKIITFLLSVCSFGLMVYFAFSENLTPMIPFAFTGMFFWVYAFPDLLKSVKLPGFGFETREIKKVIGEAKQTLSELQLLAKLVSKISLSLAQRTGRWGGYEDEELDSIKNELENVLKEIGVGKEEIKKSCGLAQNY